ncbi:hypothetical protein B0T18DRAFT_131399 [Schizothecium vesticola]|uniref:Uncharacterized protein n=1 Tax=Schizothecium vesticola TaxID=314040 RepID=A0AA40K995_9PEZI|nr:hypothetical protein B0T18DRAFT_131399 [Schizothecium vesticola]
MAANVNSEVITPRVPKLIRESGPGASSGSSAILELESGPVLPFPFRPLPSRPLRTTRFAGEHGPDENPASFPSHSGKSSNKSFRFSKELERHIARHLKSIAFISIRNLGSEDDAMSNASGRGERSSRRSNPRTDEEASEPSLLVFYDIPPEDRDAMEDATGESHLWAEAPPTGPDSETAGAVDKSAQDVEDEQEPRLIKDPNRRARRSANSFPPTRTMLKPRRPETPTAPLYRTLVGAQSRPPSLSISEVPTTSLVP